jgi:Kef-type K+ transport system membrane component KefB
LNPAIPVVLAAAGLWILAQLVGRWAKHRLSIDTTAAQYLLLGVLLGPLPVASAVGLEPFTLIDTDTLRQLGPLMSLAIGWIGLLYGASLRPRRLMDSESGAVTLSVIGSVVTGGVVAGVAWGALGWLEPELTWTDRGLASLLLGAISTATTPTLLDSVVRRFRAGGPTTHTLQRAAQIEEFGSIVVFGLLFCLFHRDATELARPLTPTEWFALSVVSGALLGLIFRLFLKSEHSLDKTFLSLVGIIVFASGMAHYMELSPLLVNLALGFTMMFRQDDAFSGRVLPVLERSRGPMYIVLLLFAGAMWTAPETWVGWAVAGTYVVVRSVGRALGGWASAVVNGTGLRKDIGGGLLPQGEVAVAMILNVLLVWFDHPLLSWLATGVLLSVVTNELWSGRVLRRLLIDAGDIQHELPEPQGQED